MKCSLLIFFDLIFFEKKRKNDFRMKRLNKREKKSKLKIMFNENIRREEKKNMQLSIPNGLKMIKEIKRLKN